MPGQGLRDASLPTPRTIAVSGPLLTLTSPPLESGGGEGRGGWEEGEEGRGGEGRTEEGRRGRGVSNKVGLMVLVSHPETLCTCEHVPQPLRTSSSSDSTAPGTGGRGLAPLECVPDTCDIK